jgi:4-hydroxybenzoate polyprenyltransferase
VEQQIKSKQSMAIRMWHFILHLRWHYQLFILSGGFLLGGFLSETMRWQWFLIQFANVHLLLFGGATAFNSYWDKDTGPVGGLKNPPRMEPWMWFASLLLQACGLLLAIPAGSLFVGMYALSMLLFWLYSSPLARWKGTPLKSLIAIGISTGFNALLMGYLAAGNTQVSEVEVASALGVACVVLSLYPVSQIYQTDEDMRRGDRTFAIRFGFKGVFHFFEIAFGTGILLIAVSMLQRHFWLGNGFFVIGLLVGLWVRNQLKQLRSGTDSYRSVMRMKFATSMAFVCFLVVVLLIKHTTLGVLLGTHAWLR